MNLFENVLYLSIEFSWFKTKIPNMYLSHLKFCFWTKIFLLSKVLETFYAQISFELNFLLPNLTYSHKTLQYIQTFTLNCTFTSKIKPKLSLNFIFWFFFPKPIETKTEKIRKISNQMFFFKFQWCWSWRCRDRWRM